VGETSGLFAGDERKRREQEMREAHRLPPGQSLTLKWPVLHYGSVPRVEAGNWDLRLGGRVKQSVRLTWEEFNRLPKTEVTRDFHCVTRWSRFDNDGVAFRSAKPSNWQLATSQPRAYTPSPGGVVEAVT